MFAVVRRFLKASADHPSRLAVVIVTDVIGLVPTWAAWHIGGIGAWAIGLSVTGLVVAFSFVALIYDTP
jgi:hypothetical protein